MLPIDIQYIFELQDGIQEHFKVSLDPEHLHMLNPFPSHLPAWTKLSHHQCPHCQLDELKYPHCPLAAHLVDIVNRLGKLISFAELNVIIIRKERTISQKTTAQQGLSSFFGLVMAASGCPHTTFFRPMARFHLPLANEDETIYRAVSTYLFAQYFKKQQGLEYCEDLTGLRYLYEQIEILNKSVAERLREVQGKDSTINALIMLDMFAKSLPLAIDDALKDVRKFFNPYLDSLNRS